MRPDYKKPFRPDKRACELYFNDIKGLIYKEQTVILFINTV